MGSRYLAESIKRAKEAKKLNSAEPLRIGAPMTKRYGRAVDRIPYDQLPPSGSPAHELGIGYTASPAQLSDDAWRAQFEDHLSDGSPSKPKKT